ncbi:MAG: tyrosine--tRNA ligase [Candidatus Portnoybacteria bacterium RIFCSPLOWO2_01_FULL_43_11]|uniref:Tyrosine--tRNA ligase n=2 Tax=Candidatus Portnoyibacteriota TaxID=1817913 RepID=A0A1G2FD63_9BACT|nr:MAG: tyrosine--tRNA ligase [Candidatus Portnoybacteria bacterium RIFCSPHIGHO2_01_FULL_40_12b]OGZ38163.1 MAG: tyrosine--tRNA ligase [Candidatus Portnoybacteria bacterium RIFCSPLOWO2_01_FULL_43_11]
MREDKIKTLLSKGVEEVIKRDSLEKKLRSGRKLRIKYGADPSAPDLHLGHSVCLWKLKEFQDLGHQVVFIIGDFTGLVGDPSGRDKTRPALSKEEIEKNAKTYFEQAGKILDIKKIEIVKNSQWFSKMDLAEFLKLAGQFTLARIIERDDFSQRLKKGIDIGFHETIYPLLQAYDSIMVRADVEVGGRDQKFNLLAGRELQKKMGRAEQDLMLFPLLIGTDGKKKMSKSLGNYIGLTESANEQYGKIMSISDDLIFHYFELCTRLSQGEIKELKKETDLGRLSFRHAKARLAKEIIALYHGAAVAQKAEKEFDKIFKNKELPSEMSEIIITDKIIPILDLLVKTKLAPSKSEAKRLVEQGGVKIDNQIIKDWRVEVQIKNGMIIQVGKRNFSRLKL